MGMNKRPWQSHKTLFLQSFIARVCGLSNLSFTSLTIKIKNNYTVSFIATLNKSHTKNKLLRWCGVVLVKALQFQRIQREHDFFSRTSKPRLIKNRSNLISHESHQKLLKNHTENSSNIRKISLWVHFNSEISFSRTYSDDISLRPRDLIAAAEERTDGVKEFSDLRIHFYRFSLFWFSQKTGLALQGHAERRIYYPFQSLQHDPLVSKYTHIYPVTFILEIKPLLDKN